MYGMEVFFPVWFLYFFFLFRWVRLRVCLVERDCSVSVLLIQIDRRLGVCGWFAGLLKWYSNHGSSTDRVHGLYFSGNGIQYSPVGYLCIVTAKLIGIKVSTTSWTSTMFSSSQWAGKVGRDVFVLASCVRGSLSWEVCFCRNLGEVESTE